MAQSGPLRARGLSAALGKRESFAHASIKKEELRRALANKVRETTEECKYYYSVDVSTSRKCSAAPGRYPSNRKNKKKKKKN